MLEWTVQDEGGVRRSRRRMRPGRVPAIMVSPALLLVLDGVRTVRQCQLMSFLFGK